MPLTLADVLRHFGPQYLREHADANTDADADAGNSDARSAWVKPTQGERFLFPVKALSPVFKGKFLAALAQACTSGALPRDPAHSPEHRR